MFLKVGYLSIFYESDYLSTMFLSTTLILKEIKKFETEKEKKPDKSNRTLDHNENCNQKIEKYHFRRNFLKKINKIWFFLFSWTWFLLVKNYISKLYGFFEDVFIWSDDKIKNSLEGMKCSITCKVFITWRNGFQLYYISVIIITNNTYWIKKSSCFINFQKDKNLWLWFFWSRYSWKNMLIREWFCIYFIIFLFLLTFFFHLLTFFYFNLNVVSIASRT